MIRFPTAPEAFIACNEARIHPKLGDPERELAAIVVELANASYQEGLNGEENTITMNSVRESYRACKENIDSSIRRWEIICWLCDKAYQEGKEAAHHE